MHLRKETIQGTQNKIDMQRKINCRIFKTIYYVVQLQWNIDYIIESHMYFITMRMIFSSLKSLGGFFWFFNFFKNLDFYKILILYINYEFQILVWFSKDLVYIAKSPSNLFFGSALRNSIAARDYYLPANLRLLLGTQ